MYRAHLLEPRTAFVVEEELFQLPPVLAKGARQIIAPKILKYGSADALFHVFPAVCRERGLLRPTFGAETTSPPS
jgi:hypothetical protein